MSLSAKSEKEKKYDRQIRLWGERGQNLLESASVCLVNATAVGCETLKSLVLPGIRSFIIVDNTNVSEADLGNNFFVNEESLGTPKASVTMKLLEELNSDVHGGCIEESVECILSNNPEFFNTFDIVIASILRQETLCLLSRHLWEKNIPLIYCRSLGLFGSIRLQVKQHCIIETHPDNPPLDLRLEKPFSSLKEHLESSEVTKKVPWPIILYHYLQTWKAENEDRVPSDYMAKVQLRNMIKADITQERENYEEAAKSALTAFGGGTVPKSLQRIFDDGCCKDLSKSSCNFWIMARALKDFVAENDNYLPVTGVLPDMASSSDAYISLQNIYRRQAGEDANKVHNKCQEYLRDLSLPEECITPSDVRLFCREAALLTILRGTPIFSEYEKDVIVPAIFSDLEDSDNLLKYYFAFRAYESYISEYGHAPGEQNSETNIFVFKTLASKSLNYLGPNSNISEDVLHEFCRYGGGELHAISSFIGGCAAQEAIKIITKQYKPIDNTFLYNGITTASMTFRF